MKFLNYILLISAISLLNCSSPDDGADGKVAIELDTGIWRGVLTSQGKKIPFNFEVTRDGSDFHVYLINGDEKLDAGLISFEGDTLTIPLGYFDASLFGTYTNSSITGFFTKHFANDYFIPFEAESGKEYRFDTAIQVVNEAFEGKWEVTFLRPSNGSTTPSVGVFGLEGKVLKGTFLTPTGDYRFLEGNTTENQMQLSAFDGEHLYLFIATLQDDGSLSGEYFSGKGGYKTWTAIKNENAALPEEELTFLKEGYDKISFTMPDLEGNPVSLEDEKYKGKVVILQIFGSWCSNCMDETKFLAQWYDQNKDRGVEIIGLAYENKEDFDYASARVKKMVEKLKVNYDFVIAGSRETEKASKTLPMLNKVFAFPTTIFIDRQGKVRKIHTGFSGPGTGVYYEEFMEEFNRFMDSLLEQES